MLDARIGRDRVPDVYRRLAFAYDAWARLTESRARARCLELASIRDGESVLEVAVGTGLAFEQILRANPSGRNEGIDVTEAMLARARRRVARTGARNYRLAQGDAYALDYPDGSFDLLVNNYMFDLLPQQDFGAVLAEFRRVLRPGGRLAMVNMTVGERWYNGLWEWIYRLNPAWLGGCRGVLLLPVLQECGFVSTSREFVSQSTFPSEIVVGVAPGQPA